MTYDVQQGFHKGTLFSCIMITFFCSMFAVMIMPNTPFLIRLYLPNVFCTVCFTTRYQQKILEHTLASSQLHILWEWYPVQLCGGDWPIVLDVNQQWQPPWYVFSISTSYMIVNVICMVALGFSSNFSLSVVIRFVHGLIDGVIPVAKAIISEISNEKNLALGTSSIFIGMSLGGLFLLTRLTLDWWVPSSVDIFLKRKTSLFLSLSSLSSSKSHRVGVVIPRSLSCSPFSSPLLVCCCVFSSSSVARSKRWLKRNDCTHRSSETVWRWAAFSRFSVERVQRHPP